MPSFSSLKSLTNVHHFFNHINRTSSQKIFRSFGSIRSLRNAETTLIRHYIPIVPSKFISGFSTEVPSATKSDDMIEDAEFREVNEADSSKTTPIEEAKLIIDEKITGPEISHSFKAETKRLLQIVANSLYSEKEIFIRELASNAADALEKCRYFRLTRPELLEDNENDRLLEIRIMVDKEQKLFVIQDSGIGMTKEELEENLGTIALSGATKYLEQIKSNEKDGNSSSAKNSIIGQFGVGFYSAFTVGGKVDVYSRSAMKGSLGYCWRSDGLGDFTLSEAENVAIGTKIVVHLKDEDFKYSEKDTVQAVLKKYSNFLGFPVLLNSTQVNTISALWTQEKSSIKEEQYEDFYKFMTDSYEGPQSKLHFSTDAPVQIRALLFLPKSLPMGASDYDPDRDQQLSLYSKKVLIKQKTKELLPPWLGFVKGVVDSEDIPLNLSRELLQNNLLIQRMRRTLTSRVVKWLLEERKKDTTAYASYYKKINRFIRAGAMQPESKNEASQLLLFESSKLDSKEMTSLSEYISRMPPQQEHIYCSIGKSRHSALSSPYMEPFKKKEVEVLVCYEFMDDIFIPSLAEYQGKKIARIEEADEAFLKEEESSDAINSQDKESLNNDEMGELCNWFMDAVSVKVKKVSPSKRILSAPALIVDHTMLLSSMKFMKQMGMSSSMPDMNFASMMPPPEIELNPKHPIIKGLYQLRKEKESLAKLVAQEVLDSAMLEAGLVEESHDLVTRLHTLLEAVVKDTKKIEIKSKLEDEEASIASSSTPSA